MLTTTAMTEPEPATDPSADRATDVVDVILDFEGLYRREYPGLLGVATALSGVDGEDVVQDTLLRAWIRWDRVQVLDRPGGWCHRVLVNLCRGRWRRVVSERRYLASRRRGDLVTAGPNEEVVAFWAAVRTLPERQRLVVALHYAGDLPTAEVASILDVPDGTVRSDLSRAREALRPRLEA